MKFYNKNFEFDLAHLKITLIEENTIFNASYYRNYSLPFTFKLDDDTSKKLGFIDDYQSRNRTLKHTGLLELGSKFEEAVLYLTKVKNKQVTGQITFGKTSMPLLDKRLWDLPFATVSVPYITSYASTIITKSWPETSHNYPMLIDLELIKKSHYEKHEGFINQTDGSGLFITNTTVVEAAKKVAYNKNVIAPCVYLMEVLKKGFGSENLVLKGDFINDKVNEKLLIYTGLFLEAFDDDNVNEFRNEFNLTEFLPDITFGAFLNKLQNWLNLDISFRKNIVTINYLEQKFKTVDFDDNTHLENEDPDVEFNGKSVYKLVYDEFNTLSVDAKNNVIDVSVYEASEIETLNMELSVMPEATHNAITTAQVLDYHQDFKICMYNGMQAGYNIAPKTVFGRNFLLPEIHTRYWANWINFRLNSLTFTDTYKVNEDSFDAELSISSGQFKYGNKHLFKKITRVFSNKEVAITAESETLV